MAMGQGDQFAYDKLEKYLLSPVADALEDMNNEGMTLLHQAAATGCVECARKLLELGANPNVRNKWKDSTMDYAIAFGPHSTLVKVLIGSGAEPLGDAYLSKFDVGACWKLSEQKELIDIEQPENFEKSDIKVSDHSDVTTKPAKQGTVIQKGGREVVYPNEKKEIQIAKNALFSNSGYLVRVYKFKKGIGRNIIVGSARSLKLSKDCQTLILRKLRGTNGKEPSAVKIRLSDIIRIYHGIQTKVLNRVFPCLHNRDDEEMRCGTILHYSGSGNCIQATDIEFFRWEALYSPVTKDTGNLDRRSHSLNCNSSDSKKNRQIDEVPQVDAQERGQHSSFFTIQKIAINGKDTGGYDKGKLTLSPCDRKLWCGCDENHIFFKQNYLPAFHV